MSVLFSVTAIIKPSMGADATLHLPDFRETRSDLSGSPEEEKGEVDATER